MIISKQHLYQLGSSILLCQLAGGLGALFTRPSLANWYPYLLKPSFTPPSWVFAPIWIFLFLLMGISLHLVWRQDKKNNLVKKALTAFGLQFILNISWSYVFFGLRSIGGGFIVIIALWFATLLTIRRFYRISRVAGHLLLPYIGWISFAILLNAALWRMNR